MASKINTRNAREQDKIRLANENKEDRKLKKDKNKDSQKEKKVKRTVLDTLPYEQFVSEYVMLLKSGVRVGKERVNLYSRTYLVSDFNYSSLPASQQEEKLLSYMELLNGFDDTTTVQVTMHNTPINKNEFKNRVLLDLRDDGLNEPREEFNGILRDKLMLGQNGIQCKKYITVTVAAINFEKANTRFLNYEAHLNTCMQKLGTEMTPLKANDRVRILVDIFRGENETLRFVTRDEFARRSEKMLCCPDYFEFKKDYFMFGEKYARCVYFDKLPPTIVDTVFKDFLETNQNMIITKNVEFVDSTQAQELVKRRITSMQEEIIKKTRAAAQNSPGGAFIDPIEGTDIAESKDHAQEYLEPDHIE